MRPTSATMIRMKDSELFNFKRLLPSMTWKPENLYAIYQRTHRDGAVVKDIDFTRSSRSVFQQRWLAKRLLKSYHSSFITTKKLERWWLPRSIPAIHTHSAASTASSGVVEDVDGKLGGESLATKDNGAFGAPRRPGSTSYSELTSNSALSRYVEGRETAGGRILDEKAMKAKKREATIPLGSLVFIHVERRLDVVIFRSCFASSVYAAKSLVVGGKVKVNGQLIRNANTLLRPGDVVSVDPKAISFIQPYKPRAAKPAEDEENAESEEDSGADKPAKQDDAHKASGNDKPFGECFTLPDYASPHIFVPAYLLPSYLTCSVVYVRHPTARPYYSEIPSPFDAGGELMSLAWEWWNKKMPKMAGRSRQWYNPQRTQERHQLPRRETYRVETGGVFNRMSPSRRPQRPVIKRTSKSVVKRASKPVAQSAGQPVTKKIRPQREPRSRPAASKPVESIHSS